MLFRQMITAIKSLTTTIYLIFRLFQVVVNIIQVASVTLYIFWHGTFRKSHYMEYMLYMLSLSMLSQYKIKCNASLRKLLRKMEPRSQQITRPLRSALLHSERFIQILAQVETGGEFTCYCPIVDGRCADRCLLVNSLLNFTEIKTESLKIIIHCYGWRVVLNF